MTAVRVSAGVICGSSVKQSIGSGLGVHSVVPEPQAVVDRFVHWGSFYISFAHLDALKSREFSLLSESTDASQIPRIFNTAGPYPIYYQDINRGIASLLQRSARDGLLAPTTALDEAEGWPAPYCALRQE